MSFEAGPISLREKNIRFTNYSVWLINAREWRSNSSPTNDSDSGEWMSKVFVTVENPMGDRWRSSKCYERSVGIAVEYGKFFWNTEWSEEQGRDREMPPRREWSRRWRSWIDDFLSNLKREKSRIRWYLHRAIYQKSTRLNRQSDPWLDKVQPPTDKFLCSTTVHEGQDVTREKSW